MNGRRYDIDGLRALAILLIVGYHAFPGVIPGGFVGVDIFFVISGFFVTQSIISESPQNFSIKAFYARRVSRLVPSLLLVLITLLVFASFFLLPNDYVQLCKQVFGGLFFISNFLLWRGADYFDSEAIKQPLLHLWSLAIEGQFYLVWPLLLYWRRRVNIRTIISIIFILSLILTLCISSRLNTAAFYLPLTRMWEFAAGALIFFQNKEGELSNSRVVQKFHYSSVVSLLGIFIIIFSSISFYKYDLYPGWRTICPVLGTILILLTEHSRFNENFLSHKWLIWRNAKLS